jgi:NADH-quinone oxidoreductase subunit L
LLIGFWFKKQSANVAAMKAFIANRVGDFGLIFAIALIYLNFGSLEYEQVFAQASNHLQDKFNLAGIEFVAIDWICILLFIGAMGKSAQIGLHVWLADAMEGPTPVSALIHAATMVTAGVFLVIRCSPLFELSPIALPNLPPPKLDANPSLENNSQGIFAPNQTFHL